MDMLGTRFAWRESGSGPPNRTVVVLLHGLGGSRISWGPQFAGLGDQFRLAAWDLPGYGKSPPLTGPVTFDALADAVVDLADELGASRVHLCGISFGGMIAQYATARHPTRIASLTLLATSPKFGLDGTTPQQWQAARLAPLDAGLQPVDFADRTLRGLCGPNMSAEAFAQQRAAMARVGADALRSSIGCLITHDSRHLLGSITAPTLCLVGSLDTETPTNYSEAIACAIPGASVHVIEGAGHLLNAEAPDEVNELLAAHICRAESL